MSVEIMGKIWGMALPHQQKMVLLSMADHADHEGKHIYPSLGLLAWKTDYSVRQVRRIVAQLVDQKILTRRKSSAGKPSHYNINIKAAPQKPPYRQRLDDDLGHDDLGKNDLSSSVLGHHDLGHDDLDLGHHVLPTPDIAVTPKPSFEPSLTKNKKTTTPSVPQTGDSHHWPSVQAFVAWYTEQLVPFGAKPFHQGNLSPKLQAKINSALTFTSSRDYWARVSEQFVASPFLRGLVSPSEGHKRFKTTLEWLVSLHNQMRIENYALIHNERWNDEAQVSEDYFTQTVLRLDREEEERKRGQQ